MVDYSFPSEIKMKRLARQATAKVKSSLRQNRILDQNGLNEGLLQDLRNHWKSDILPIYMEEHKKVREQNDLLAGLGLEFIAMRAKTEVYDQLELIVFSKEKSENVAEKLSDNEIRYRELRDEEVDFHNKTKMELLREVGKAIDIMVNEQRNSREKLLEEQQRHKREWSRTLGDARHRWLINEKMVQAHGQDSRPGTAPEETG